MRPEIANRVARCSALEVGELSGAKQAPPPAAISDLLIRPEAAAGAPQRLAWGRHQDMPSHPPKACAHDQAQTLVSSHHMADRMQPRSAVKYHSRSRSSIAQGADCPNMATSSSETNPYATTPNQSRKL